MVRKSGWSGWISLIEHVIQVEYKSFESFFFSATGSKQINIGAASALFWGFSSVFRVICCMVSSSGVEDEPPLINRRRLAVD